MNIALITGASSGLGREFARRSAGTPTFGGLGRRPAGGPAAPAGVPVRLPGAPVP